MLKLHLKNIKDGNGKKLFVLLPTEKFKTITPTVKALKGAFTAPTNFNYKKELSKRLSEKYLW
jgi:hypothetical protein